MRDRKPKKRMAVVKKNGARVAKHLQKLRDKQERELRHKRR